MHVKMHKVTVEPVEVELPSECPHCGASEAEYNDHLGGVELSGRTLSNGLVSTLGDVIWDEGQNNYEPNYLVSILCGECEGVLINLLDEVAP